MKTPYEIRFHRLAERSYRRIQGPLRERINAAIDALVDNPVPVESKKLAGHDDYRIRVGDYRIVYAVDHSKRLILIARIAHRREVYRP